MLATQSEDVVNLPGQQLGKQVLRLAPARVVTGVARTLFRHKALGIQPSIRQFQSAVPCPEPDSSLPCNAGKGLVAAHSPAHSLASYPALCQFAVSLPVILICVSLATLLKMVFSDNKTLILRPLLLLSVILLLQACVSVPENPENVCSMFSEKRGWHKAAVKAEKKWGTSMHIPMAFMYQESAFRHKAKPPRTRLWGFIPWRRASSAFGYAQAIDGTWSQYIKATGDYWRVRHDFADATDFIHWYLHRAMDRNGVAGNDAYNLYLNYHEGPAGFARKTHLAKPWLDKAAQRVQMRYQRYNAQYEQCKESLKPGFFGRLLGW